MKIVLGLLVLIFSNLSAAQSAKKPQTLDFEGEIIEGEAMRPDLFLQISTPDVNLESIIYMRKDFNDFHKIDKIQKPKYVPEKK